ncbi:GDP-perosamine synthase-like [Corticium candelabrum]|uniref:GDP-perosamine synthase-like n=1 Tax=Corticium candelabrum TaxID=121492 RepID=UPI002E266FE7|nr:GDP-perosamine synthase-like [Corticium candelabrum]
MSAYVDLPDHLQERLRQMSQRVQLPLPEPPKPSCGWKFPVAIPYISPAAKQSVCKALDEGLISSATRPIKEFEDELMKYFNVSTVKACNSGYSALVLCLRLAGIKTGDEVLVPSLTMVAVPNAVSTVGGESVFIDVGRDYNPTVQQIESVITSKTKAVLVTHTYGVPADLEGARRVCNERNLILIEDISECIGTWYNEVITGTIGDFAAASLYANKLITSGDGGFVLSKHREWNGISLQYQVDSLANHGFVPNYHFVHFDQSGNYKMGGLAAALITPAVRDIPKLLAHRTQLATWYRNYLSDIPGITLMPKSSYGPDAPWVFGVEVKDRKRRHDIRCAMATKGIETRDFFIPLHLQPAFQRGEIPPNLPQSEHLGEVGFYLPTHFHLNNHDVLHICNVLRVASGAEEFQGDT